jgi:uncharacterized protein (TIGR00299 family) protein
MRDGRFAILDPVSGISGDMLLGALVDAGAPRELLSSLPGRLGFPEVRVEYQSVVRCGITAVKVHVRMPDGSTEEPHDLVEGHSSEHRHGGHPHTHPGGPGAHRHLSQLLEILDRAEISPSVRARAGKAFHLLCEAEGRVHGVSAEEVSLHEVGALDSLVDIVGAIEAVEALGLDGVFKRPIALGGGWVRVAHGLIPVPAPVTMLLLEGLQVAQGGPVSGEATTPTGAVLLRVLTDGPPPAHWRGVATGWGAGGRDPEHYPNAHRLVIAAGAEEAGEVVMLATDLDDLSPEYLEPLRESMFAAGALDVQVWTTQAKKGRPGFRLEASAPPAAADRVIEAMFVNSTTVGVRRWTAERVTLSRRQIEIDAGPGVLVRVKVVESPGGSRAKPEYEDVNAAARRLGRPAYEIAREVQAHADRILAGSATAGSPTPKEEK